MKSHQTSVGKKFLGLVIGLALFVSGCTIVQKSREDGGPVETGSVATPKTAAAAESPEPAVADGEVSIREDMTTIEDLRKNIPEQKRQENDALKNVLSLLGEVKAPPAQHRDKFNRVMRDMREKRRREAQKTRENFNKKERKDREAFLKDLKESREKFNKSKTDKDERKDFYNDQDMRRREFFANERDARKEFESEIRQQDSDFNAFYREKNDEFNKELRIYTQSFNDLQKAAKEKERSRGGTKKLTTDDQ
jgi:hypothetical protein